MGLRFRKSISLGKGVRVNISKSGIGMSAGVKGARIGLSSRKGTYVSGGIPGTGIYGISYAKGGGRSATSASSGDSAKGCLMLLAAVIGLGMLVAAPLLAAVLTAGGVAFYFWYSRTPKAKTKKLVGEARKLLSADDNAQALTKLREAEKLGVENDDLPYLLGAALNNTRHSKEAIPYLEKHLSAHPDDIAIQMALANCYYSTDQFDKTIRIIQSLPEDAQNYPKALSLLGLSFAEQKKFDLAIDVMEKGPLRKRRLDDTLIEYHYNTALIYESAGDKKKALKHFKKVYAENTSYKEVSEKIKTLEGL